MEHWDIYNADRIPTGKTIERDAPLQKGEYHLVVHVCIFNPGGELLIQKRQPWKSHWPGLWDVTVGGRALAGESSIQAAQRETLEELGLAIDLSDERPFFTMNFEEGFDDFYLVERNIDISDLVLQKEEVEAVMWASKEKVLQMIKDGIFIEYYFAAQMFEMRKQRGSIKL